MKVKELIKDTVWTPGSDYDVSCKPAISVLLPTFRRGKSGLFRKAVDSVLDQTLEDIELIIVDDASTDGTADQIAEFMARDGRVSCLRHPYNIGLPAISEYEAFMRARADYIAFAFDDDFFYPDALEKLLDASEDNPGKVCFGSIIWRPRTADGLDHQIVRLGQPLSTYNLNGGNCISNNAVLLPRAVIEDVGLYDPHILLTRLCDWDLWLRVSRHYLLHYVDMDVGEVTGPETTDSLGNTYALTLQATSEWMRWSRQLSIETFPELDVFETPTGLSKVAARTVADLMLDHVASRPLFSDHHKGNLVKTDFNKSILVLCSSYDASTSLYFEFLPSSVRGSVRILHSLGGYALSEIAYASCIVIVRNLSVHKPWIDAAKRLKIPLYYFLDDNLPELVANEGMTFDSAEDFKLNNLRTTLKDFTGVLLTSEALKEYFSAHLLHDNLYLCPVSYAQIPPKLPDLHPQEITFASMGGGHRHKGLFEYVMPALLRLASPERHVHFVIGGVNQDDESRFEDATKVNSSLRITCLPFEPDWTRAILQIGQYRPNLLIHAASKTLNRKYKTLHAALCAFALDAVLVVADDPPFNGDDFKSSAYLVDPSDEPRAWLGAFENLLSDPSKWPGYKDANTAYCRSHFSGEQNVALINNLLQSAPAVTSTRIENRLKDFNSVRTQIVGDQLVNIEPLQRSLSELSRLRMKVRKLRRFMPRASKPDIWPHVSPAFEQVRQHVLRNEIRKPGRYLEVSSAISDVAFLEYEMSLAKGVLKNITCAFTSDGFHNGILGVEFCRPDGTTVFQTQRDAAPLNLDLPVTFNLDMAIAEQSDWRVRLFARSQWPIYVYEFAEYSWFGLKRRSVAPFASVEYADLGVGKVSSDHRTRAKGKREVAA